MDRVLNPAGQVIGKGQAGDLKGAVLSATDAAAEQLGVDDE